ncbi:hypothetical protein, conserved [Eimeria praecox]|uniref:Uncharacterized protein n=1 Tax=Eimeria praecox TaxID=51316 RepID=U6H1W2_9EIME|nr:hypothetical protein, conserved [Eimeria praecox]
MLHSIVRRAAFQRNTLRPCRCDLLQQHAAAAKDAAALTAATKTTTPAAAAAAAATTPPSAAARAAGTSCRPYTPAEDISYRRRWALSGEDRLAIQADGVAADAVYLQRMQQTLATQIPEACEYYGIAFHQQQQAQQQEQQHQQQELQQQEQQQPHTAGLRVGLLLPPSPLLIAAVAAVAAVGGTAVPLPFCDAAVAAETAAAAAAAAGGVAAASAAVARPLAAAVEEVGGEIFVTRTFACSNSVICSSKSLRLLQQQLSEARTQLLLVHPALAGAAATLCEQLGLHACICGARTPASTDICIGQQQQQQQAAAAAAARARLFVKEGPLCTRSLSIHTKWVPLRTAEGGPLKAPQELKEALAVLESSGSDSTRDSTSTSTSSSSSSSGSKSNSNTLLTSDSWGLLLEASRCWGQPRSVVLSAAAAKQQLQRNKDHLLHHVSPGHDVIVAAAAAALAKPKLLLAAVLPLVQQQASILLLSRQQRPPLPLPLQVTLQQLPADAAAEALVVETPPARAAEVWGLLLQQKQQLQQQPQQQQQYTLVMDVETAEAMLAHYELAVAAAAATEASSKASTAVAEAPLAAAADLAAAAQQTIRCCVICTDESDFIAMPGQTLRDTNCSSSSLDAAAVAAKPAVRVAAVVKGWQLLLPASAAVQHVLALTEAGVVVAQQQQGSASALGVVPLTRQQRTIAAEEGQAEGIPVGRLLPGVVAMTAEDGVLLFSTNRNSIYFERPVATAKAFGAPESLGAPGGPPGRYFRSALLGSVDASGEVRVLGCTYSSEQPLQRPLQQRLQQWQWSLPRMERLIEGYVHKVPITGKEWGNYHAKKRHWKRIF